jgi:hypothetical protein
MRRTLDANGVNCELIEAAASTSDGVVPFSSGGFTLSRIEAGGEPVRAVDVLPRLRDFDLVKIDIEGGEWELLEDARFPSAGPPALVVEYHTHLAPADADAEGVLERAGYSVERRLRFAELHGLLWALRRQ